MAIELAVFDMAGTTVADHGAVNRCFRETLAAHGLAVAPDQVDAVMGLPKPEAFRILVGYAGPARHLIDRLDTLHAEFVLKMMRFYADDPSVREVPGVGPLFDRLRRAGVKVALDTGFSRDITDVILRRLGWDGRSGPVAASVASGEVPNGRPHPDMIRNLMTRLGVADSKAVVKVGDTPADLEEGLAAGCRWVVGVTWGSHPRALLERYPHTHLVDSVEELCHLFDTALPPAP